MAASSERVFIVTLRGIRIADKEPADGSPSGGRLAMSLSYIKAGEPCSCFDIYMRESTEKTDAVSAILVVEADSAVRESLKCSLEVERLKVRAYEAPDRFKSERSG